MKNLRPTPVGQPPAGGTAWSVELSVVSVSRLDKRLPGAMIFVSGSSRGKV